MYKCMSTEIVKLINKAKTNRRELDRIQVESFFILVELVIFSLLGFKMHSGIV